MKHLLHIIKKVWVLYFSLLLFACGAHENSEPMITEDGESQSLQLVGSKQARKNKFVGKPHAPIDLKFTLPKNLTLGESQTLDLILMAGIEADDLLVTLRADEGLVLLNNQQQFSFGPQKPKQKNPLYVSLRLESAGLYYLYVSAVLVNTDKQQSRNFVIPVQVGNVRLQKTLQSEGRLQQEESQNEGEAGVVSMPAVETTE